MTFKEWWSWVRTFDRWSLVACGINTAVVAVSGGWQYAANQVLFIGMYLLYISQRVRGDRLEMLNKEMVSFLEESGEAGIAWQRRSQAFEKALDEARDNVGIANMVINGRGPRPDKGKE